MKLDESMRWVKSSLASVWSWLAIVARQGYPSVANISFAVSMRSFSQDLGSGHVPKSLDSSKKHLARPQVIKHSEVYRWVAKCEYSLWVSWEHRLRFLSAVDGQGLMIGHRTLCSAVVPWICSNGKLLRVRGPLAFWNGPWFPSLLQ